MANILVPRSYDMWFIWMLKFGFCDVWWMMEHGTWNANREFAACREWNSTNEIFDFHLGAPRPQPLPIDLIWIHWMKEQKSGAFFVGVSRRTRCYPCSSSEAMRKFHSVRVQYVKKLTFIVWMFRRTCRFTFGCSPLIFCIVRYLAGASSERLAF